MSCRFFLSISIIFFNQAQSSFPVEKCELSPRQDCKEVSTQVPSLELVEKCVDIPKDVCSKVEQPRTVEMVTKRMFCNGGKAAAAGKHHQKVKIKSCKSTLC